MEDWIWLSRLPSVGPILQKRLLEEFVSPENIYRASVAELMKVEGVGEVIAQNIAAFRIDDVRSIVDHVEKFRIKLVTIGAAGYDEVFACKRSPILFYYRGTLPAERGLAVVGSRRCTEDAKRAAEDIANAAAQSGTTVVSGLAKGVDSYAHTACLRVGGYTIAVLANGVDICYPPEHKRLYERIIAESGAVLSAYPPGVKPHPKFFLERNAHISAWSTDVVIVQASEKSGSLTTARFAQEQGRKLYVVPHSIHLNEAKGSNQLLEQGAHPYLGPNSLKRDCIEIQTAQSSHGNQPDQRDQLLATTITHPIRTAKVPLSPDEERILTFLNRNGSCSIDQLAHHLQVPELDLTPPLILMEMNQLIKIKGRGLAPLVDI